MMMLTVIMNMVASTAAIDDVNIIQSCAIKHENVVE